MRRLEEVFAARHVADLLFCIVYDNRNVVGGAYILARKDNIAEGIKQDVRVEPMFSCVRARCFSKSDFPDGVDSAEKGDCLSDVQANCI